MIDNEKQMRCICKKLKNITNDHYKEENKERNKYGQKRTKRGEY